MHCACAEYLMCHVVGKTKATDNGSWYLASVPFNKSKKRQVKLSLYWAHGSFVVWSGLIAPY